MYITSKRIEADGSESDLLGAILMRLPHDIIWEAIPHRDCGRQKGSVVLME